MIEQIRNARLEPPGAADGPLSRELERGVAAERPSIGEVIEPTTFSANERADGGVCPESAQLQRSARPCAPRKSQRAFCPDAAVQRIEARELTGDAPTLCAPLALQLRSADAGAIDVERSECGCIE